MCIYAYALHGVEDSTQVTRGFKTVALSLTTHSKQFSKIQNKTLN